MGFPFEKIGDQPIDLNIQEHRDIVIQRNKKLNNAIENGLCVTEVKFDVCISVEFECLKCGYNINVDIVERSIEDITAQDLEEQLQSERIKCRCCNTKYRYDHRKETFDVTPPKPKEKITKLK